MAANRMGPPCPNCGSLVTDVKSTHRSKDGDFVRRRACPVCEHRFNTVQPREAVAHTRSVQWQQKNVATIFWQDLGNFYYFMKKAA